MEREEKRPTSRAIGRWRGSGTGGLEAMLGETGTGGVGGVTTCGHGHGWDPEQRGYGYRTVSVSAKLLGLRSRQVLS